MVMYLSTKACRHNGKTISVTGSVYRDGDPPPCDVPQVPAKERKRERDRLRYLRDREKILARVRAYKARKKEEAA